MNSYKPWLHDLRTLKLTNKYRSRGLMQRLLKWTGDDVW